MKYLLKEVIGLQLCTYSFEWVQPYVKGDIIIIITIIVIIVLGTEVNTLQTSTSSFIDSQTCLNFDFFFLK